MTLIKLFAVAYPNLISIGDQTGLFFHQTHLNGQFIFLPKVIHVQKGNEVAFCEGDPQVAGAGNSAVFLPDIAEREPEQFIGRTVCGTIINDDDFHIVGNLEPGQSQPQASGMGVCCSVVIMTDTIDYSLKALIILTPRL